MDLSRTAAAQSSSSRTTADGCGRSPRSSAVGPTHATSGSENTADGFVGGLPIRGTVLAGGERPKLGVDLWQLIGELRCPVLSIRGTRSNMYAAETVAKMKAANPRLQVAEVEAGHP